MQDKNHFVLACEELYIDHFSTKTEKNQSVIQQDRKNCASDIKTFSYYGYFLIFFVLLIYFVLTILEQMFHGNKYWGEGRGRVLWLARGWGYFQQSISFVQY